MGDVLIRIVGSFVGVFARLFYSTGVWNRCIKITNHVVSRHNVCRPACWVSFLANLCALAYIDCWRILATHPSIDINRAGCNEIQKARNTYLSASVGYRYDSTAFVCCISAL